MEYTPQLAKSLNELNRITGLSLDIHTETTEEMEQAAKQLQRLSSAYQKKYDKNYFLEELLKGHISTQDIHDLAARYHISLEEPRILFLLETNISATELVTEILKHLFPAGSGTCLLPTDSRQIVVLQTRKKQDSPEEIHQAARTISDTLNMEALTSVRISYSDILDRLEDIPDAFRDTRTALKIGTIFNAEQMIYPCSKLGIGQLIYELPATVCENFLREVFGEHIPHTFDDELFHTVNIFFKNNLNIAETARQLHMHRNTLIYRLEQIQKKTGLDLRIFEDAIVFRIASMVISYLQTKGAINYE